MKLNQAIQQHMEKFTLPLQSEVLDYVLYLEQKAVKQSTSDRERREHLTSALKKVVAINPFAAVDPAAWEQEQRSERVLPGRE